MTKLKKKNKWSDIVWTVLFLIIGIASIMDGWKEIKAKSDYKRTTGIIYDNRIDSVSDVNGNRYWHARYQYEVDGIIYENWDYFRKLVDEPQLDKKVTLYYDEDDPDTVTMGASVFRGVGVFVIGIVFLFIFIMICISSIINMNKNRQTR